MNTFPNWRDAGRVLRWARKNKVTVDRKALDCPPHGVLSDYQWTSEATSVVLSIWSWRKPVEVVISAQAGYLELSNPDVARLLRVLASLDLIPAELAEVRDEWYGRCVHCGGICFWDDGNGLWAPRWIHLKRLLVWGDAGPHLAEVKPPVVAA